MIFTCPCVCVRVCVCEWRERNYGIMAFQMIEKHALTTKTKTNMIIIALVSLGVSFCYLTCFELHEWVCVCAYIDFAYKIKHETA